MSKLEKHVLVTGNTICDILMCVEVPPSPDGKEFANQHGIFAGGQAANVAITLSGLGVRTLFQGAFGDDVFGEICRRRMSEAEVDLSRSRTVMNCSHAVATVTVARSANSRSILIYKDKRLRLDDREVTDTDLNNCAAVYLDGHEEIYGIRLAKRARERGIPVFVDIEIPTTGIGFIPYATHLIAPEYVISALGRSTELESAANFLLGTGPRFVVATLGARGARGWSRGGDSCDIRASKVNVVDTTGAGDAFHAAFVAAMLSESNLKRAIEVSVRLAAMKCRRLGPTMTREDLVQARALFR